MCLLARFSLGFVAFIFIPVLAFAQAESRATALGTVGVSAFVDARGARVASAVKVLADAVVVRMNARTYLKAKSIAGTYAPGEKQTTLKQIVSNVGVDGLLLAEVADREVRWNLVGSLGQVVSSGKVESAGLGTEAEIALTADRLVDNVAASVPYRAYITKELGLDVYEINMGTISGIAKGQKLRIFDFGGRDFRSKRTEIGMVEVVGVKEWTAEVEAISGAKQMRVFQKIAFDERARGMSVDEPTPTKGYVLLGGGLLAISSDSPSAAYDPKVFRLNSTPSLILGAGFGKIELTATFAQAQNTTEDLIFSEIIIDRQFKAGGSGLWGWKFLGGLRIANYNVTKDSVVVSQLESLNAVGPHLAFLMEKYIGGPLSVLAGAEAMPLTFYSPGGFSLFSYGAGAQLGLRFDFNPRWSFDTTGRLTTYRRPVDGDSAVQERHSNVSANIRVRF